MAEGLRLLPSAGPATGTPAFCKSGHNSRRKEGSLGRRFWPSSSQLWKALARRPKCMVGSQASELRHAAIRSAALRDLEGQKVVVVGLGSSGRAAARLALERGAAEVVGVDSRTDTQPLEDELSGAVVRTEVGPHKRDTLLSADRLVLSPGVPPSQPDIAAALQAGIPPVSELAFAAEALPRGLPIAAVSGTNGKSTVTTFTGQFLESIGVHAFVGGNLGTPLSEAALHCLANGQPPYQAAVVEVSSYQMEFSGSFHPKVAVILNLTPDHLERHGSMEAYGAAKCRMFQSMTAEDLAVIPQGDALLQRLARAAGGAGQRAWLGALPGVQMDSRCERAIIEVPGAPPALLDCTALRTVGRHNALNAATAALLAHALQLGTDQDALQAALPQLQPPPHRMQTVCEDARGVLWIDDSKATNVESTLAGVQGVLPRRAVVLLGGQAKVGTDGKGLGFARLVPSLMQHRAVVLFGQSGAAIEEELQEAGLSIACERVGSMLEAVERAKGLARQGEVVLLSPACASFDEFTNFMHRGRVFAEAARKAESLVR